MAEVLTFGCGKYGAENWRRPPFVSAMRIYRSVLRHLLQWAMGTDIDAESGLPHLWHAATALAMLATKLQTQPGVDDRWQRDEATATRVAIAHELTSTATDTSTT